MSAFSGNSTADEVLEGVDLTGKRVFITGGSSGLGQETARAMLEKGARVVLAARDQGKLDAAAKAITNGANSDHVETLRVDLASLKSIQAGGFEANSRFSEIDLLINNAGVMACPQMLTADGFEMQFGTNHLGHFLLTKLLMPLIFNGVDKRIVNLSSRAHHLSTIDLIDPNFKEREYEKWKSYGQSKTANILFSVGLEKRFSSVGIHSIAVHPGGIVTNLGRHMTDQDMEWMMKRMEETQKAGGKGLKTIPQGAATTCWAATSVDLSETGGVYCEDCHIAKIDDEAADGGVRSYALEQSTADGLWALSEDLVGETFA